MVLDVEKDCTFDNPVIVRACKYADEQDNFDQPCKEGQDYYVNEGTGGGLDLSTIDFSQYSISELLDLKRRYDAGEFDNYGAEEILHPFLKRCKEQCVSEK